MFFLLDLAGELDLEEIHAVYRQKDPRGEKAYEPRMMVLLLLYAYCVGLPSSRKIEKACWACSSQVWLRESTCSSCQCLASRCLHGDN